MPADSDPVLLKAPEAPPAAVEVTIVITTRDRCSEVLRAVESALRQTGPSIEVLVIDDGSQDDTSAQLASRFSNIYLYRSEHPRGPAQQRNFAARAARGEYLVGLDDDAEFKDPRTVAQALEAFAAGDDIGVVALPRLEHLPDGRRLVMDRSGAESVEIVEQFMGAAYAVRRTAFLAVGGYDEEVFYCGEERDLSARLLGSGYLVRLCDAPAVEHHRSAWRRSSMLAYYGRRNDVLFGWRHVPTRDLPMHALRTAVKTVWMSGRIDGGAHVKSMLVGMVRGARDALRRGDRRPLERRAYQLMLDLRRSGPMPLALVRARRDTRRPA